MRYPFACLRLFQLITILVTFHVSHMQKKPQTSKPFINWAKHETNMVYKGSICLVIITSVHFPHLSDRAHHTVAIATSILFH